MGITSQQMARLINVYLHDGEEALTERVKEILESRSEGYSPGKCRAMVAQIRRQAREQQ